ncbi:MAG: cation transporter, partial [Novosphingobium sp.]|nr:cation transporter [Novosphingobium sp.]
LERFALASIAVALIVMAIKALAWRVTGSVALYSDALESTVNVVAAVVAFASLRYSRKPPDEDHPFGHHKSEYFSAVIEGVLIVVASGAIIVEAVRALLAPHGIDAPWTGLAISAVATAINAALGIVLTREGRSAGSPALKADGQHVLADVYTSAGVIVGLVLAVSTGIWWLDPLLAVVVALNVLWQGFQLVGHSVDGLMDHAVDAETQAAIEAAIAASGRGAGGVHDLKTRVAGRVTFIEFHLTVPGAMPVWQSHAICDQVEAALMLAVPRARVTIHVEPDIAAPHGRSVPL